MIRAALAVAAVVGAALAAAGPAAAQHGGHGDAGAATTAAAAVQATFGAFAPARIDVLTGDTVRWTNVSVRPHTVTAADHAWDSGRLVRGAVFDHRFEAAGTVPYVCLLHPFMRGEVGVHDVLLAAPGDTATPGVQLPLTGRSSLPSGSPVTIEADTGAGYSPVASTTVDDHGGVAATVTATATADFRAVTADGAASPAVRVVVVDRHVTVTQRRRGRATVVTAAVTPPAPGLDVVLQLRLRERFGWWPVRRTRLDEASRARLVVRRRAPASARVLLTLRDGATELARSETIRVGGAPGR